jgi:hypothetical protein
MPFAAAGAMATTHSRRSGTDTPRILELRATRVVLDTDLASLYGVSTGRFNQAVKRNRRRFPKDFAFRLTAAELQILKSQSVISSGVHGGRRTTPLAFTEHGAIMAASVLNTRRAIDMSVFVVRAFLRLRDWSGQRHELAERLADLEQRVSGHDQKLRHIIVSLRQLLEPPDQPRRLIGFAAPAGQKKTRSNRTRTDTPSRNAARRN